MNDVSDQSVRHKSDPDLKISMEIEKAELFLGRHQGVSAGGHSYTSQTEALTGFREQHDKLLPDRSLAEGTTKARLEMLLARIRNEIRLIEESLARK